MVKLLIIADDFTGALDTGVQFAARGVKTRVVMDVDYSLAGADCDVLVMDTETRHVTPKDAYALVSRIVSAAVEAGVPYVYKLQDFYLKKLLINFFFS